MFNGVSDEEFAINALTRVYETVKNIFDNPEEGRAAAAKSCPVEYSEEQRDAYIHGIMTGIETLASVIAVQLAAAAGDDGAIDYLKTMRDAKEREQMPN